MGMFKTRNMIEGLILTLIPGIPLLFVPFSSITTKISVILCIALPLFLFGLTGMDGDPLSIFLMNAYNWKKSKRMILFDNALHMRKVNPTDLMMARELPKDKIVKKLDDWKAKKAEEINSIDFIEGQTFEFSEDKEYTMYKTEENKILNISDTETNKKEPLKLKERKSKKQQKNSAAVYEDYQENQENYSEETYQNSYAETYTDDNYMEEYSDVSNTDSDEIVIDDIDELIIDDDEIVKENYSVNNQADTDDMEELIIENMELE